MRWWWCLERGGSEVEVESGRQRRGRRVGLGVAEAAAVELTWEWGRDVGARQLAGLGSSQSQIDAI